LNLFVLDACALLAVLAMEKGAENIRNLFQKTIDRQVLLMMKYLKKQEG
jgi:PIN domain nuclease of toxin-antitoxin system